MKCDRKSTLRAVRTLLSVLAGAHLLLAQDFLKKDYRQWSKEECQKMLQDSPWARRLTQGYPIITPDIGRMSPETANELIPEITYIVQLRSALPIRQALAREQQIEQKYDRMSVDQKQAFDQSASRFLGATFPDTVIVYVEYSANAPFFQQSLARYWQTTNPETLKRDMYVISHGEKIPPIRLVVAQGSNHAFEMVFPRTVGGRPLLDPAAKSLAVEFQAPLFEHRPAPGGIAGGVRLSRVYVEFKAAKMIVQGQLHY